MLAVTGSRQLLHDREGQLMGMGGEHEDGLTSAIASKGLLEGNWA